MTDRARALAWAAQGGAPPTSQLAAAETPIACALHAGGAPPGSCQDCQAALDALIRELRDIHDDL